MKKSLLFKIFIITILAVGTIFMFKEYIIMYLPTYQEKAVNIAEKHLYDKYGKRFKHIGTIISIEPLRYNMTFQDPQIKDFTFETYYFRDFPGVKDTYAERYIEYANEKNIINITGLKKSDVIVRLYQDVPTYDFSNDDPVLFLLDNDISYGIYINGHGNEENVVSILRKYGYKTDTIFVSGNTNDIESISLYERK